MKKTMNSTVCLVVLCGELSQLFPLDRVVLRLIGFTVDTLWLLTGTSLNAENQENTHVESAQITQIRK